MPASHWLSRARRGRGDCSVRQPRMLIRLMCVPYPQGETESAMPGCQGPRQVLLSSGSERPQPHCGPCSPTTPVWPKGHADGKNSPVRCQCGRPRCAARFQRSYDPSASRAWLPQATPPALRRQCSPTQDWGSLRCQCGKTPSAGRGLRRRADGVTTLRWEHGYSAKNYAASAASRPKSLRCQFGSSYDVKKARNR